MLYFVWPIALVVAANIIYQICAKSVPNDMNPFAALTITYLVAAISSGILYYTLNKDANLLKAYTHINWAPFALGLSVVGLEVGFIYAYRAGWEVSTASIVQSSFLAVALVFVGYFIYNETISANKIIGVLICMVGLYFINK